jgi:hypothetical protein
MKILPHLLFVGYLVLFMVSCVPFSKPVDIGKCYVVAGGKKLTIQVNEKHKHKTRKPNQFPKSYVVQVIKDKDTVESVFYLPRTKFGKFVLAIDPTQKYYLSIYKKPTFGGFTQIAWRPDGSAFLGNDQTMYYVSVSKSGFSLAAPAAVTSKDGRNGDGVKVVIE